MVLGALRFPTPIEDIEQERLFDDEVVVVARRDHALMNKAGLVFADLASHPWVMPRRSTPLRRVLDTYFAAEAPTNVVETSSVIMMREILRQSDHLGGLSRMQAEVELGVLGILPVRLPNAMRPIGITTRAGWEPTRAQRELRDVLRQTAAELN
ncbi:LysR substrate binding domain protein [compost metagenome]